MSPKVRPLLLGLCAWSGCTSPIVNPWTGSPVSNDDEWNALEDDAGNVPPDHGRTDGGFPPDASGPASDDSGQPPDDPGQPPDDPSQPPDDPGPGTVAACAAGDLGARIGFDRLLVGGSMDDSEFDAAPFDLRYRYLANDVPAGGPCGSCASGCPAAGSWWGCWQSDNDPPGRYVVSHVQSAEAAGALPMITYYTWFTVAGSVEGSAEIAALADGTRVARYLADWRFACQKIAEATAGPVILHAEPDLWGFGQKQNDDPNAIVAAVSAADAPECSGEADTMAGLARCMLAIARAEAPSALVGFHASAWGAGSDALHNGDPDFDVPAHAARTAEFMAALGADAADLVVVEMSDRDAGQDGRWWDPTNAEQPNFDRAMGWAASVGSDLGLPFLWWQIPLGHMDLPGGCQHYADNRVDYFFDHATDFAADGALGIAFGAGASCGTTAATDDGHFVSRANAHLSADRPCLCGDCP